MSQFAGRRILNTRPVHQAGKLDDLLRSLGAEPVPYPCIAIEPPLDLSPLDAALDQLAVGAFDWLVLTSQNSVEAVADRVGVLTMPQSVRVAVVGPATANAARRDLNLRVDFVPVVATADVLAESLPFSPGERVLIPQSAIAPVDLAAALSSRGARVQTVAAYRTVAGSGGVHLAHELIASGIDAVVFTSSSAVRGYVQRTEAEGIDLFVARALPAVSIGPSTANAARNAGFRSVYVASEQSVGGLAATLHDALAHHSRDMSI